MKGRFVVERPFFYVTQIAQAVRVRLGGGQVSGFRIQVSGLEAQLARGWQVSGKDMARIWQGDAILMPY